MSSKKMDYINVTSPPHPPLLLLYSSALLLATILIFLFLKPTKKSTFNHPPGPQGWPLFGHIFILKHLPHIQMAKMKEKYGPVVWLKIGSIDTMVVLTANAAAEVYKNHDLDFSNRTVLDTVTSHDYHKASILFSPYGPYWRMARRLCNAGINSKLNDDSLRIRRKGVDDLLAWVAKEGEMNQEIKIVDFIFLTLINVMGNVIFSQDLVQPNSKIGSELFTGVTGFFHWISEPNISDVFSWIKPFDIQGLKKNMDKDMGSALEIVSGFIKERIKQKQGKHQLDGGKQRKDLLDVLLEFEGKGDDEPEKLSQHTISVFCLELFFASADTVSSTIEWALAELLRAPENLVRVKDEMNTIVGQNRRFEERDIDNLPFLQAIIKETLRLHPPAPMIPKKSTKDTCFMGHDIPKDTQVIVNAWAIGRDPKCWNEPLSFKPERFMGSNIDYKGQDFELIPFGAGRRMCAGFPLAHRLLPLMVGSLLHEFDWELNDYSIALDMTEKTGSTIWKLEPLKVIPRKRVVLRD